MSRTHTTVSAAPQGDRNDFRPHGAESRSRIRGRKATEVARRDIRKAKYAQEVTA